MGCQFSSPMVLLLRASRAEALLWTSLTIVRSGFWLWWTVRRFTICQGSHYLGVWATFLNVIGKAHFNLLSKFYISGNIAAILGRVRLGSYGIRIIEIMRVSVCFGSILIPEYLDFHSGYSTPRSRIAGIYSGIYSYPEYPKRTRPWFKNLKSGYVTSLVISPSIYSSLSLIFKDKGLTLGG